MSGSEPPDDVSKSQLWDRLRKLEKHVYPDRRDVLKAGVGAAVGGAAVLGSSGAGSAATASGQVGTSSNPVDVEAVAVNAEALNSAIQFVGSGGHGSIQAAHDALPADGGTILVADSVSPSSRTQLTKPVKVSGSTAGGVFGRTTETLIDVSGGNGLDLNNPVIVLEDLILRGNGTGVAIDTPSDGTQIDGVQLRNVTVEGADVGAQVHRANSWEWDFYADDCTTDGVRFVGAQTGDFANAHEGMIYARGSTRDNVRVDYSTGSGFSGNDLSITLEGAGAWGLNHLGGTFRWNELSGYGTEGNTNGGLNIQTGEFGNKVFCRVREGTQNIPDNNPRLDGTSLTNVNALGTTGLDWRDVSGSRTFGTWYQAPGYNIEVSIQIEAGSTSATQRLFMDINTSQSGNVVGEINWSNGANDAGDTQTATFTVPANHYYRLRQFSGTAATIAGWDELDAN